MMMDCYSVLTDMRPGTQLEKRVESLSKKMKDLTPAQREWGLSHLIHHYCIFKPKSQKATCVDCGHIWQSDNIPNRCSHCGARLTIADNPRQRRFVERSWYCVIRRVKEFTVVRIFYIYDSRKIGEQNRETWIEEVLQHWINAEGKDTIRCRNLAMFPDYRYFPFSLGSNISLKRDYDRYGYRNPYYHITPSGYYPRKYVSEILKRNGFTGVFRGFNPEDVFCFILSDNRFETLWKTGLFGLCERYLKNDKNRITKYWKAVLQYHKFRYHTSDLGIWLDYLDLLEYFHKDLANPAVILPKDLNAEHDKLVRKKAAIEARIELERRKEQEKEKLAILESKRKYFDITFNDGKMMIVVLKSLEDYKAEGDYQHHCVYTNGYYGKKGSLILSARLMDNPGRPVETVEISLKNGQILQCYGKFNKATEYHQEILDLVNKNIRRFLKKPSKFSNN